MPLGENLFNVQKKKLRTEDNILSNTNINRKNNILKQEGRREGKKEGREKREKERYDGGSREGIQIEMTAKYWGIF